MNFDHSLVIPAQSLDATAFAAAVEELCRRDPDVAAWRDRFGLPTPWWRPSGYTTLVRIIIEQQVSLASAEAVFSRLCALAAPLTPERFLTLSDTALRAVGLSRQKQRYLRILAEAVVGGQCNLAALATLPDAEVRAKLTALTGIGPWTADVYLLMALRRPDAWPASDLGLLAAFGRLRALKGRPKAGEIEALVEPWRPYRGVAAWLLWHGYLSEAGLEPPR